MTDADDDLPLPEDRIHRTMQAGLTTLSEVVKYEKVPDKLDSLVQTRILELLETESRIRTGEMAPTPRGAGGEGSSPSSPPSLEAPASSGPSPARPDLETGPPHRPAWGNIAQPPPGASSSSSSTVRDGAPNPPSSRASREEPARRPVWVGMGFGLLGFVLVLLLVWLGWPQVQGFMATSQGPSGDLPAKIGEGLGLTVLRLGPGEQNLKRRPPAQGEVQPVNTEAYFRFEVGQTGVLYLMQRDPQGNWACLHPGTGEKPSAVEKGRIDLTRKGKMLGTQLQSTGTYDFVALLGPPSAGDEGCRPALAQQLLEPREGWSGAVVTLKVGE